MAEKSKSLATVTHLYRHTRFKAGLPVEDIAAEDGVSVKTILSSIKRVEAIAMMNTQEHLKTALIATVLGAKDDVDAALGEALRSTVTGREGVQVPNHTVRMKAISEFRQLAETAQPKNFPGRPVNVAVHNTQQTAVATQLPAGQKYEGFEERLRTLRSKIDQHNQLPPPESIAAPAGDDEIILDEEEPDGDPPNTQGEPVSG
jgi:hypothetical protein